MEIDSTTIKEIKKNNRKVTLDLYHHSYSLFMSIAVRYHNNKEDQMDIVNTAFMKIVNNIDSYKVGTNYFAWAKQITKNVVIDLYRKNKKYKSQFVISGSEHFLATSSEESESLTSEMNTLKDYEMEEVERILNQLPPATKITFNLHAIDGYSYKEIAKELDIGFETVKWHIKDARKRLRNLLEHNTLNKVE